MSGERVTKNSRQMTTGKAFEYALLSQFEEKLKDKTNVEVIKNPSFDIAKGCFDNTNKTEQSDYLLSSSFAVNFLMDIEPRLSNDLGKKDILQLEILSDNIGKEGDVRDILAIRLLQKWEIGVSAKNNNWAVKRSRLSSKIDFGEKWLVVRTLKDYRCAKVLYQGTEYPIKQVTLPEFGNVRISTCSLNDKLLNKNKTYVSTEAQAIDEKIFFFVDEQNIYMPNADLRKLIIKEVL